MIKFAFILLAMYIGSSKSSVLKELNGAETRAADALVGRYFLVDKKMTWAKAKANCETLGGHLATLASYAEVEKVSKIIELSTPYWIGGQCKGCTHADIDDKTEKWTWTTGETLPMDFKYWKTGTSKARPYDENDSNGIANRVEIKQKETGPEFWNENHTDEEKSICQSP